MWQIKHFKNLDAQKAWIAKNEHKFQITILFVNNGWAVEFKKLRVVY